MTNKKTMKEILEEVELASPKLLVFNKQSGSRFLNMEELNKLLIESCRTAVKEVRLEKKYAETQPMATDYGNVQNALLRQHIESYNKAIDEASQKEREFFKE